MRFPMLKPGAKKRVLIDRCRGYSHTPEPGAGAFYDMENLSGEAAPLLRTLFSDRSILKKLINLTEGRSRGPKKA